MKSTTVKGLGRVKVGDFVLYRKRFDRDRAGKVAKIDREYLWIEVAYGTPLSAVRRDEVMRNYSRFSRR